MNLSFHEESYEGVLSALKGQKKLWKELSLITRLDCVRLKSCGENNDLDNFQIFTPRFIVDDMLKAIGIENITNFANRILEPTSGDGAFTCRILELRLDTIEADGHEAVFRKVLESLGTIYSVELDGKLVKEQRDNIYTIAIDYLAGKGIALAECEDAVLRLLIHSNFIWAETNIDQSPTAIVCDVAYRMPDAQRKKYVSVEFPVWSFGENRVSLHYEAPEVGY